MLAAIADPRGSPGGHVTAGGSPILQPTDEPRRSGSHYTPRSLTEPIVRHALKPAFERIGAEATPDQVLEIEVCDPACGSGASWWKPAASSASGWRRPGAIIPI